MRKRMLYMGIFLLTALLAIGVMAVNTQAGIDVYDGTRTIILTDGHYDISRINNTVNDKTKLWNQSNGVWLSNYSIIVDSNATFNLNPNATGNVGCIWLKLNNYTNVTWCAHINVTDTAGPVGGILWVNDTLITGWNETIGANTSYVNLTNLRPWIFIHGGYESNHTQAYFLNSTLGYLGYNQSERYGIVYKDTNESGTYYYPRGWMHNCTVLENYIGIAFQGVPNMNVTDSWFNDSKSAGIVYTVGTGDNHFANNGYVGVNKNNSLWTSSLHEGVSVVNISGSTDPTYGCDGIRLRTVNGTTFDNVDIINCTNMGMRVISSTNLTINNTIACLNTEGFSCLDDNNNTFIDCIAHNNTYDFKFHYSVYNVIVRGYANDSTIGVYIIDVHDTDVSHHNIITDLQINRATFYAISIGSSGTGNNRCYNNTIDNATVTGTTSGSGIFLFDNVTDNVVINSTVNGCTNVTADGMGLSNDSYNNTFINCNSSNNGYAGFSIIENANNNTIDNCTGYGNADGLRVHGDNSKNNTILYCTFWNNDYGVCVWPGVGSNCVNNSFIYCEIHNNSQAGVNYGYARINHFRYCNIKDNTVSGVKVEDSGNVSFYKCLVWNPSATQYDWIFESTTTVGVRGDYILGYSRNCNNQTAGSPYGNISHAPGDGAWNLYTKQMKVYTSAAPNYCVINLTAWTGTTYRKWIATSNSCTTLYQLIGGLSIGTKYDLIVDDILWTTLTAFSRTIIPGEGATGCVWFNYSGPWSTHTFEIEPYTAPGPSPGPGPGPGPAVDENDISVYVLTNGEDVIVGALVYIYENSVLLKTGTTDTDGLYETTLDDGTFKFVANADGYKEEYQVKAITDDTTVVFHLTPLGFCPTCLAGAYLSLSVLGWILAVVLVVIGFLLAYLIDSKQIKKDYLVILLIPNAILVILGIICHPILIIMGVSCAIIQLLWAGREEL